MSGVSGSTSIALYLSTIKNEASSVATYIKSDAVLQRTVASFTSSATTLTSSTAILGNYQALQVLTGAFDMSSQISETAILKDLMTQSADSSTSLVSETDNTDYLHFARATSARTSQTVELGSGTSVSLTTTGASATTLTMENTFYDSTSQTATDPGVQWSFVLNDGTADDSIASALESAASDTDSTATYSISSSGVVTASEGAPAVTTSTDSAGNTVYTLALATSTTGAVTKKAEIVSVGVTAGTSSTAIAAQQTALTGALTAAGFDATLSSTGALTVIDPAGTGTNTLARAYGVTIATATSSTLTASGQLALGAAAASLKAGDVLTDGSTTIGTVQSVDSSGNVTLTTPTTATIDSGDSIEVATGMAFTEAGTTLTATAQSASGATVLNLGTAGASLQPGQAITAAGVTIGTVSSVTSSGMVTLTAGLTQTVTAGTSLVALPVAYSGTTAALDDASNVSSIVSDYEENSYESSLDSQYPGIGDALYYTRTMGSITSITELMSNSTLLSVVTEALGMSSYFGELDYDQQKALLTSKVNLTTMTSAAGIKQTAEQYMIAVAATSTSNTDTGILSLFTGTGTSSLDLLSLINGVSSTSTTTTTTDPILALF